MEKLFLEIDAHPAGELEYREGLNIETICSELGMDYSRYVIAKLDNVILPVDNVPGGGCLNLISIDSTEGNSIRMNTTLFVMLKAFHNCFNGQFKVIVEHSIGDGVYCEVFGNRVFTLQDLELMQAEMERIIAAAIPITRAVYSYYDAFQIFVALNRKDVLPLLHPDENIVNKCGDFHELIYAQIGNSTKIAQNYELYYHSPGFILRYPRQGELSLTKEFHFPKKLFSTHQEHDKWLGIINLHMVKSLNRAIKDCSIREKIHIEEALQERKLVKISDDIMADKNLKLVLIAGPSSSGKTTFSKRLAIQLIVNGIKPLQISLDNYFLSHDRTPRKPDGEYDFENIQAIDLERLNRDLTDLMSGREIELPKYNFQTGESRNSGTRMVMGEDDLLVIEGIHGLNDLLTQSIPFQQKTRIYVSALNNLNIDEHNRISTSDCRRIRRLVRDSNFRGIDAETTLKRWDDIRAGEEKYIFPFQENADYMFNSILTYELAVLRYYARPLLASIKPSSCVYSEALRLLRILDLISDVNPKLVPGNSIIREFIDGSIFKY
ncbi:MAG: nucleoside kinase [Candidatus Cloacimonetes bacterium]|nr:nucleoside kinase [Candidatus Cloacimonadota bacterium]